MEQPDSFLRRRKKSQLHSFFAPYFALEWDQEFVICLLCSHWLWGTAPQPHLEKGAKRNWMFFTGTCL